MKVDLPVILQQMTWNCDVQMMMQSVDIEGIVRVYSFFFLRHFINGLVFQKLHNKFLCSRFILKYLRYFDEVSSRMKLTLLILHNTHCQ